MDAAPAPDTVVGADPDRFRGAAEVAVAAVAQIGPAHFARGLERLGSTLEYLLWHARKFSAPFDVARVFDSDEFVSYSECRWDEESLGLAAMVLVAARTHRDTQPGCGCVLHRTSPFDTGTACLTLRHPWDWAGGSGRGRPRDGRCHRRVRARRHDHRRAGPLRRPPPRAAPGGGRRLQPRGPRRLRPQLPVVVRAHPRARPARRRPRHRPHPRAARLHLRPMHSGAGGLHHPP